MGMFFHDRGEAPPERPADPEVRRANMRRIGRLFKPYWQRLSALLGLIVVLGFFPQPALDAVNPTVTTLLQHVDKPDPTPTVAISSDGGSQ